MIYDPLMEANILNNNSIYHISITKTNEKKNIQAIQTNNKINIYLGKVYLPKCVSDTILIFISIKIFNSPKENSSKMTVTDEKDQLIMFFFNEENKPHNETFQKIF